MKHDIIGRVLKILRIEKRPGESSNILVQPKLQYTEDPSVTQPYSGLEIPHWQWIKDYVDNASFDTFYSLLFTPGNISLDWSTDIAPDESGGPSGETYEERYGNTPQFQVWLQTSPNNFSLETVPITMSLSGGNIATVNIDTSGIAARIIIK